ncbi:MAG: heavy-metal-associated domain-containing protein [Dethiobacter sp.]|jgi:copper chaperone|nr:heavy-metal-associated domain-containing protein [Dethiobacter sp.]
MSEQIVINIGGMSCNHCKMAVEKALKSLDGVEDATVDLAAAKATVNYDAGKVSGEDLKGVISEAGYEVK